MDQLSEKWAAVKEARERAEKAESLVKDQQWVISRITKELKDIGIELQWSDGGGSAAPSGWHRNPYINALSYLDMKAHMENALVEAQRSASETYKIVVGERDIAEHKVVALEKELMEMAERQALKEDK